MERKSETVEVVLSSALGAMIATLVAAAIGFPWWPVAIVGVGAGAFFCFRPGEVIGKIRAACHFACDQCNALLALPSKSKWNYAHTFARHVLLSTWIGIMVFIMALFVALSMVILEVPIPANETFVSGVLFFGILGGCVASLGVLPTVLVYVALEQSPSICGWVLLRWVGRMSYALFGVHPAREGKNLLTAYWSFFDARDRHAFLRVLSLLLASLLIMTWMYWGAIVGICFAIDAVVTLALALASRPRLAVMWGTMIGGTIGYFMHVAHPVLPVATFVGMFAGGVSGGALYCVRLRIVAALHTPA